MRRREANALTILVTDPRHHDFFKHQARRHALLVHFTFQSLDISPQSHGHEFCRFCIMPQLLAIVCICLQWRGFNLPGSVTTLPGLWS
jgi:hypothetical protein